LVRNDVDYRDYLGRVLVNLGGSAYFDDGDYRKSIELINEAIAIDSKENKAFAWLVLALAHKKLGDEEAARRWLEKCLPLPAPYPASDISKDVLDEVVATFHLPATTPTK
jgi:tetratricopeptide (TPR) repeat protein